MLLREGKQKRSGHWDTTEATCIHHPVRRLAVAVKKAIHRSYCAVVYMHRKRSAAACMVVAVPAVAVAVAVAVIATAAAEQLLLTQDRVPWRHLHMTKPIGGSCCSGGAAIIQKTALRLASAAGHPRQVHFLRTQARTCMRASSTTAAATKLLAAAAASTERSLETSCLTPQMYCSDL
jgi:hypothetical protein